MTKLLIYSPIISALEAVKSIVQKHVMNSADSTNVLCGAIATIPRTVCLARPDYTIIMISNVCYAMQCNVSDDGIAYFNFVS